MWRWCSENEDDFCYMLHLAICKDCDSKNLVITHQNQVILLLPIVEKVYQLHYHYLYIFTFTETIVNEQMSRQIQVCYKNKWDCLHYLYWTNGEGYLRTVATRNKF